MKYYYGYLIVLLALIFLVLPIFAKDCNPQTYTANQANNLTKVGYFQTDASNHSIDYFDIGLNIQYPKTENDTKIIIQNAKTKKEICRIILPKNSRFFSFVFEHQKYVLDLEQTLTFTTTDKAIEKYFTLFQDISYSPKQPPVVPPAQPYARDTLMSICQKEMPPTGFEPDCISGWKNEDTHQLIKDFNVWFNDLTIYGRRSVGLCLNYNSKDYCSGELPLTKPTNYSCTVDNTKIYLSINPKNKKFCVYNPKIECNRISEIPKDYSLLMPKMNANIESNKTWESSLGYGLTYNNSIATMYSTKFLTKKLNADPSVWYLTLSPKEKIIYKCSFPSKRGGTFDKIFAFYPNDKFEIYDKCGQKVCETYPTICKLDKLPIDVTKYDRKIKNLTNITDIYDKTQLKYDLFHASMPYDEDLCIARKENVTNHIPNLFGVPFKTCFNFNDLTGKAIKCTGNLTGKGENGPIYFALTNDKKKYIVYTPKTEIKEKTSNNGEFWKQFFTRMYNGIYKSN